MAESIGPKAQGMHMGWAQALPTLVGPTDGPKSIFKEPNSATQIVLE